MDKPATIASILERRIQSLNDKPINSAGKCVLYVMSRDQRVHDNAALFAAQQTALRLSLPLAVVFCLNASARGRAREHYQLMLAGLQEVEAELTRLSIPFIMVLGDPREKLAAVLHHYDPAAVYFDMNPLVGPRQLQQSIAISNDMACFVVDAHNIVPVWQASPKCEYAARTFRPKVLALLAEYLQQPVYTVVVHPYSWPGTVKPLSGLKSLIHDLLETIPASGIKVAYTPGRMAALQQFRYFLDHIHGYAHDRNDPTIAALSGSSFAMHYGWLSAREVVSAVQALPETADTTAFLEEFIVRRELSDNYCYYTSQYRTLAGAPEWARRTLQAHITDPREYSYKYEQFRDAATHDELWNAAQRELRTTGKMHGYMRMYWAKKVLEWSADPQQAIDYLCRLNDFYSIDGGEPSGYVGIMWSIAGLHDRPWFNRPIFGLVRYMSAGGLQKKFDTAGYIARTSKHGVS